MSQVRLHHGNYEPSFQLVSEASLISSLKSANAEKDESIAHLMGELVKAFQESLQVKSERDRAVQDAVYWRGKYGDLLQQDIGEAAIQSEEDKAS